MKKEIEKFKKGLIGFDELEKFINQDKNYRIEYQPEVTLIFSHLTKSYVLRVKS